MSTSAGKPVITVAFGNPETGEVYEAGAWEVVDFVGCELHVGDSNGQIDPLAFWSEDEHVWILESDLRRTFPHVTLTIQ